MADHASHALSAIAALSSSVDERKRYHVAPRACPRLICRHRSRWLSQTCQWGHRHDAGREHPSAGLVEALSRVARSGPSRQIIVQQPPNRIGIPWGRARPAIEALMSRFPFHRSPSSTSRRGQRPFSCYRVKSVAEYFVVLDGDGEFGGGSP